MELKTFNPVSSFTSPSSPFNGDMSDKCLSSSFCLLNFTLLAIVSFGSNFTSSPSVFILSRLLSLKESVIASAWHVSPLYISSFNFPFK